MRSEKREGETRWPEFFRGSRVREDPGGEFRPGLRSRSRAQYVSLCYPRISLGMAIYHFLRSYTNIYRSPFLYARKTRGPMLRRPISGGPSFAARFLARAFVYDGIKRGSRESRRNGRKKIISRRSCERYQARFIDRIS